MANEEGKTLPQSLQMDIKMDSLSIIHNGTLPQEMATINLPPKPAEPQDSDCCGSGCTPCVFDLYEQDLRLWQRECDRLIHGQDQTDASQDTVLSEDEYNSFELVHISQETKDTRKYSFAIPNNQKLPISVGQHIVLRCQDQITSVTRQYTPVSDPNTRGQFHVIIKEYEKGAMSRYVRNWKCGDLIDWRGPFGNYTHHKNQYRQVVMLAAGTGIAPMVQIARQILQDPEDEAMIHLLYACKTYEDILCKSTILEWTDFWNFQVTYYLSQETTDSIKSKKKYRDRVVCGRILQSHIAEAVQHTDNCHLLICGTKSFNQDMLDFISGLNIDKNQVHTF